MLGQTIANYRLTSLLAQERDSAIYAGEDVREERAVAIQVRPPQESGDATNIPRVDDSRALSALRHPNIARVIEAGLGDGAKPYVVMEPLDGETLAARLRVQAAVRAPEALAIAREVAGALEAAHAAGIVHGHLTTANVFITLDPTAARGERVKLLGLVGGPSVQPAERRADCRAVGELLFEMLCGFPPSLVEEATEGERAPVVPPASSLNPDVPEALDRLISATLARGEEGARSGSMAHLRKALDGLALGAPALETSAFDVPPVALPVAPPAPVVAAAPSMWRRALAILGLPQPARMVAGAALVSLVVALSIFARRSPAPRPAGHAPRMAAASAPSVPAAPPVQMAAALPVAAPPLPVAAEPPSVEAFAAPPAPPPAERLCHISIGSKPWSQVWIDGKNTGRHTPLLNYRIACGERTLTLKNAQLALSKSVVVTLKPRSRLRKVIRLVDAE